MQISGQPTSSENFEKMPNLANLYDLSLYPNWNYNITSNLFYIVFRNDIPSEFVWLICFRCFFAFIGTFLKAALAYVAFTSKSLYGPCNAMIGLNALCSAFFQPHLSVGLFLMLSNLHYINIIQCAWMMILATLSYNFILATMFFIALDRLFCVRFIAWHRHFAQHWHYLALILLPSLLYSLFFLYATFSIAMKMPELQIICSSPDDLYQGPFGSKLFQANFVVCLLVIVAYLCLWLTVRLQNMSNSSNQRIIRSLSVMMLVLVFGWLLNALMRIVLPLMPELSPMAMCYLTFASAILPHIAIASNAPILYVFSNDYRRAFHLQMPWLFSHFVQAIPLQTVIPKSVPAQLAISQQQNFIKTIH